MLFMLRNIKCKPTVEIVMRNESNVLNRNGNTFYLNCEFRISIKPTSKIQVTRIKFTTISKILNANQMLIFPSLSIHYSSN
jgi:hypothetical protein